MRPEVLRPLLVAALLLGAGAAAAQAPPGSPTEVTNLRLAKGAGTVQVSWDEPVDGADSYQVRRCLLTSLPVPYYGNCVADGLTVRAWEEPVPSGAVFYLVSADLAGVEGSIGRSFNGSLWRERIRRDCSLPEVEGPMTVSIRMADGIEFCGSAITLYYPGSAMTFSSAACAGLTSGFLGQTADFGDHVRHLCASAALDGPVGPGTITQVTFDRSACPVADSALKVAICDVTDCDTLETIPVECTVR